MKSITPFLWFDHQAEEAARFYVSVFENSRLGDITRYGPEGPGDEGSVMTVSFELRGQEFVALNGGPLFSFTQAISFVVNCDTQREIDDLWERLPAGGGRVIQCGWLRDRYGLPWQVVPAALTELMRKGTAAQCSRMMRAMLKMTKLDLRALTDAYGRA